MSRDDPKCDGSCAWGAPHSGPCPPEESPMTREETPATKSQPFDQNPRPLEPAQNGYLRCFTCESVVSLPHKCPGIAAKAPPLNESEFERLAADNTRLRALVKSEEHGAYRDVEGVGRCCCPWCNAILGADHVESCPAFLPDGVVR